MKSYACDKCGSVDVFIDDRGRQQALTCGDCGAWLKWIGKKEMPLVERFIKENKTTGQAPVKSFEEVIHFHREKEDNWEIQGKAKRKGFKDVDDLRYLGEEISLRVAVSEDMKHKIIEVNGVDVSDKNIYL